jgi:hypothetical protein
MIPDITFKEFVNNLFDYTKTPLENRNWITATKDNLFTYAYTWAEIEDYINRWLKMVPIDKLDVEVNTAFEIMDTIVVAWYLLNFNHTGGRTGYFDEPYIDRLDNEEFYLHTQINELIWNKVRGLKEAEKARLAEEQTKKEEKEFKFEDYLLCLEDKKKALMEKLELLYKTAKPKDGYIILRGLEEAGFMHKMQKRPKVFINAINERFGVNFKQQNYSAHKGIEEDKSPRGIKNSKKLEESIKDMANILIE